MRANSAIRKLKAAMSDGAAAPAYTCLTPRPNPDATLYERNYTRENSSYNAYNVQITVTVPAPDLPVSLALKADDQRVRAESSDILVLVVLPEIALGSQHQYGLAAIIRLATIAFVSVSCILEVRTDEAVFSVVLASSSPLVRSISQSGYRHSTKGISVILDNQRARRKVDAVTTDSAKRFKCQVPASSSKTHGPPVLGQTKTKFFPNDLRRSQCSRFH